ncbi:MAG: thioredoxin family protein [Gammaproteobacteria bacterium]|nr:thioredoxin family protein [Gammaproteobacteria bacterium]MBU1407931.1 thioredoxin family protein [Gammaproteobacteria bacterium]MBU1532044.1 thioredoxin family protein [Gammaproteobacteria bacterium]
MRSCQEESRDSSSPDAAALPAFSRLAEGGFHARLAATAGVAVVLFSAPHCGSCRAWKRLLPEALAGVADTLFEVDVSEATGVARYFGIFHLPTVYLYRDGRFHAELQCEARQVAIRETARQLLAAPAQDEP